MSPPFFVASTLPALAQAKEPLPEGAQGLAILAGLTFLAFVLYLGVRVASRGGLSAVALLGIGAHLAGTALYLAMQFAPQGVPGLNPQLPLWLIGGGLALLLVTLVTAFVR